MAELGFNAVSPENEDARLRLPEMRDFYAFAYEGVTSMIEAGQSEPDPNMQEKVKA